MALSTPPLRDANGHPTMENGRSVCGRVVKNRGGGWCERGPAGGIPGKPCRSHGGASPQVKNAIAREKAEGEVRKTAAMIMKSSTPITDPLTALQELVGEMAAWKEAVAEQVDILKLGYSSEVGTEQIRAAVQLYERALDRLGANLAAIAKLNIDERLVAIQAGQKEMILRAIQAALASAGVNGPAATAAIAVAGQQLRVLAIAGRESAGYN